MSEPQIRRYSFKLYPTPAQDAALREQAAMCALLWNALLQMREDKYRRERKTLSAFDQGKAITELRAELAEWREMPRGTQERVADMLDLAFKAFFRRAKQGAGRESGYPRYKRIAASANVPLREPVKSCWKFTPKTSGSWRLKMRGVPGALKARGEFPASPVGFKTADLKFYDGAWWFSVCVSVPPRRTAGRQALTVSFDLIDEFAAVTDANGRCAPGLNGELVSDQMQVLSAAIQSARDTKFVKFSCRWRREVRRIARLKAREARRRREALHKWTTAVASTANVLTIIAPPIKDNTKTGRGNEKFHGAEVETIAALNRSVLSMAPAMAIQMLEYKMQEVGAACAVIKPEDHQIRIGRELRAAAIETRRARRKVKKMESQHGCGSENFAV